MASDFVVDLAIDALHLIMLLVTVLVLPGLIMGIFVSLFQAATQINEQTISFLPRLLVTLLAMIFAGHWISNRLMQYCLEVFERAAQLTSS